MEHFFAYVYQNDKYGIGGSYLLHGSSTLDLASQLAGRASTLIDNQLDQPANPTDDLEGYHNLLAIIEVGAVGKEDLLGFDIMIDDHIICCHSVAHGQKELASMFRTIEDEISQDDPDIWVDGTDPLTGFSKETASALVNSIDDDVLFAELLEEMNEVLFSES